MRQFRPGIWLNSKFFAKCLLAIAVCTLACSILYGLLSYRVIRALYESKSPVIVSHVMRGKVATPLIDYIAEADRRMLRITSTTFVILFILILALKRPFALLCVGGFMLLASTAIVFLIELDPPLSDTLHLGEVEVYSDQKAFVADPELIYKGKPFLKIVYASSTQVHRKYGVDFPGLTTDFVADEDGFRNNPDAGSDLVVLGDGMINSGRNADDTFTARLAHHLPGLSVRNLGTGGHGPFQYVTVLQKYGLKRNPRYALFSFNEGNDIQNIRKNLQWRAGLPGSFNGGYEVGLADPLTRFTNAYSRTLAYVQSEILESAEFAVGKIPGHEHYPLDKTLAWVELPTKQTFPMVFIDRQNPESSERIQKSEEWQQLKATLTKFSTICAEHGVKPIFLFIPTAAHIYAEYSTDRGGSDWRQARAEQVLAKTNLESALVALSNELGIPYLTLSPTFEQAARNGQQVYESFEVHMTSTGAELSAQYVAREMRSMLTQAVVTTKEPQP